MGAWALTEPVTGSDAMRMNTTARKEGDNWVINGAKNFITHGSSGDVIVVVARTGELGDSRGISAIYSRLEITQVLNLEKKKIN